MLVIFYTTMALVGLAFFVWNALLGYYIWAPIFLSVLGMLPLLLKNQQGLIFVGIKRGAYYLTPILLLLCIQFLL